MLIGIELKFVVNYSSGNVAVRSSELDEFDQVLEISSWINEVRTGK